MFGIGNRGQGQTKQKDQLMTENGSIWNEFGHVSLNPHIKQQQQTKQNNSIKTKNSTKHKTKQSKTTSVITTKTQKGKRASE